MAATREYSAGSVIVRRSASGWELGAIVPRGRPKVRALPKGHIDSGEHPEGAAIRETREETGLTGRCRGKLGEVKYAYRFEGQPIFKSVTFFLLEWESGEIDQLTPETRVEVEVAFWLPLERATQELSYPGERQMAKRALEALSAPP